jgi:recombination protein RecR
METPLDKLVHELAKLPTVGEKTAMRLALHILRQPPEYGRGIIQALHEVVGQVGFCERCFNLSVAPVCRICDETRRDTAVVCVVADIADLLAIERTRRYHGLYHVLHGTLSPIDGIGPEDLRIAELVARLECHPEIREVILAVNHDVSGEVTAVYISKLIRPSGLRLTRLAAGIPVGGSIEFIDQSTLSKAMESRVEF